MPLGERHGAGVTDAPNGDSVETGQDALTQRMARVQAQLNAQAGAVLRSQSDLTPARWRILSLIASGQPTRLMEICRLSGMDKGQVSRNLSQLVAAGLLRAERDTNDMRSQRLEITETGRQLHARLLPAMQARQDYLLGQLDATQRDALDSALDTLEQAAARRNF